MLESLRELRNHRTDYSKDLNSSDSRLTLAAIEKKIQAEIDSAYMLLPVDADGVPIRPGDQMTDYSKRVDGHGIAKWDVVSVNECAFFDMSNGLHIASQHHHVKQRTLEDALIDLLRKVTGRDMQYIGEVERRNISDCATEIRELMGGAE